MARLPADLDAPPIRLTRCRPDHLDQLMAAISDSQAEVAQWLPWADPMPTAGAERAFIEDRKRAFDEGSDYGYFLIEPATGELVGGCGLHIRATDRAEIGYWVRSNRTGRGYATAAAGALTSACMEHLPQMSTVIIRMDQANAASAAIPPKLGYVLTPERENREPQARSETGLGLIWHFTRPART